VSASISGCSFTLAGNRKSLDTSEQLRFSLGRAIAERRGEIQSGEKMMNTRAFVLTIGCLCAFLSGCGTSIEYTPLNAPPRPMAARPVGSVEIFTTQAPSRPFVEVGLLEARQASAYSVDSTSQVMRELVNAAARRGCDAVVVMGSSDSVVGSSNQVGGSVKTLHGYRATCVLYR